jgi:hypothetical protein
MQNPLLHSLLACSLVLGLSACEPPPKPAKAPAGPQLEAHSTMTIESNGPAAPATPPPVAVSPLTVKIGDGKKTTVLEVKADGTINADGKLLGKFAGNAVQDDEGHPRLVVDADGSLKTASSGAAEPTGNGAKFDATDAVLTPNGDKIMVGDDGTISHVGANGKTDKLPTSIEGFTPTSKREVLMVVLFATLPAAPPPPPPPKTR